ncbi:hypothetical protein ACR6C2_36400 [Streptomyces sp. INA 01156]
MLDELRELDRKGRLELSVHDYFDDDALWDCLIGLDVSVLPYRFGTHSGDWRRATTWGPPSSPRPAGSTHNNGPASPTATTAGAGGGVAARGGARRLRRAPHLAGRAGEPPGRTPPGRPGTRSALRGPAVTAAVRPAPPPGPAPRGSP